MENNLAASRNLAPEYQIWKVLAKPTRVICALNGYHTDFNVTKLSDLSKAIGGKASARTQLASLTSGVCIGEDVVGHLMLLYTVHRFIYRIQFMLFRILVRKKARGYCIKTWQCIYRVKMRVRTNMRITSGYTPGFNGKVMLISYSLARFQHRLGGGVRVCVRRYSEARIG